jgi:hypothetical protein
MDVKMTSLYKRKDDLETAFAMGLLGKLNLNDLEILQMIESLQEVYARIEKEEGTILDASPIQ